MKALVPLFLGMALSAPAFGLGLPTNARLTAERVTSNDRYAVPIAPFDGTQIQTLNLDGAVQRQAFQIPGAGQTTLQMIAPLRAQLEDSGFRVVLDCIADQCGGFDFRFGIDVFDAPAIYIDLSNYQFLSFVKGPTDAPDAAVTLLLSTTRDASYIQIVEVTKADSFETEAKTDRPVPQLDPSPEIPVQPLDGPTDFLTSGRLVLTGVDFASGATSLGEGPFPLLDTLAQFLTDNPAIQIALVGHTDSVGSLNGNIRVSRARAQAVKTRLVQAYNVNANRIEAEGAGYLSPIASNLSEGGRASNRRVEAVILRADQ